LAVPPSQTAGLPIGGKVVAVNGVAVESKATIVAQLKTAGAGPIAFTCQLPQAAAPAPPPAPAPAPAPPPAAAEQAEATTTPPEGVPPQPAPAPAPAPAPEPAPAPAPEPEPDPEPEIELTPEEMAEVAEAERLQAEKEANRKAREKAKAAEEKAKRDAAAKAAKEKADKEKAERERKARVARRQAKMKKREAERNKPTEEAIVAQYHLSSKGRFYGKYQLVMNMTETEVRLNKLSKGMYEVDWRMKFDLPSFNAQPVSGSRNEVEFDVEVTALLPTLCHTASGAPFIAVPKLRFTHTALLVGSRGTGGQKEEGGEENFRMRRP
jgi:flagellar biosynthesis GTPase FlhF